MTGVLEEKRGVRFLRLSGGAGEMGLQYGRYAASEIESMLEHYVRRSETTYEVPTAVLISESKKCKPFIPSAYLDEIAGVAEGSGTSFTELLALNCLTDVDGCHTQKALQCCNFVVAPPATSGGLFLHGRNLDFPPAGRTLAKCALLVSRQPHGNVLPTISFTFAGIVGMFTGYNAAQLTCAEVAVPDRYGSVEGVPLSILLRQGLESASDIQHFYDCMAKSPRTCGYNLAIADGKTKDCRAIEMTRRFCEKRSARRGILVVDDVCFCKKTATMRLTYPSGAFRYARMIQLLSSSHRAIDIESALEILSDTFDLARGRDSGNSYNCICNHHTALSVLFLPAERRMLVAQGNLPAPSGPYVEFHDSEFWDVASAPKFAPKLS